MRLKNELNKIRSESKGRDVHTESATQTEIPEPQGKEPKSASSTEVEILAHEKPSRSFVKTSTGLEEFIGGNLINKVGIAVVIIGVGIGVKYAIDHDLISPLMRIVLGYILGGVLMGLAVKLLNKYLSFSAVLFSGSMAIFYFITYAAHSYYALIPVWLAFVIMTLFTIITVAAALKYNREVIAHIGLLGAYILPFLFNETISRPGIIFSFMAIINAGILFIAYHRTWNILYYVSFILTWVIFISWFIPGYDKGDHFTLIALILPVFFALFYLIFILNNITKRKQSGMLEILILLINAIIFYTFGMIILSKDIIGEDFLGLFTFCNALVHSGVAYLLYRARPPGKILVYLVTGLAVFFLTLSVPIEVEGHWITIIWAAEAFLFFWIGKSRKVPFYLVATFSLAILTFFSLAFNWFEASDKIDHSSLDYTYFPMWNTNFLAACCCMLVYTVMIVIHQNPAFTPETERARPLNQLLGLFIPIGLILVAYFSGLIEFNVFWDREYLESRALVSGIEDIPPPYNRGDPALTKFRSIWEVNYSMAFFCILSILNIRFLKSRNLGIPNLIINGIVLFVFLVTGLTELAYLQEAYIDQTFAEYFQRGTYFILIRYVSFMFAMSLLLVSLHYAKQKFLQVNARIPAEIIMHLFLLVIASSELVYWMRLASDAESFKLELSILWGLYAVMLIILGIWKKKKYLRIGSIILFGITLLKIFLYDLSDLDTISKTIVFIVMGSLMLIVSFLYIKYRSVLFGEEET
jgi:uncharacterized membrane protein